MNKTIEDLLKEAKKLKSALNSDKIFCGHLSMFALIEEGADVIKKNIEQIGGSYVTEVVYRGYIFQTVSERPLRIGSISYFSKN